MGYLDLMGKDLPLRDHLPSYYVAAVSPIQPTSSLNLINAQVRQAVQQFSQQH